MVGKSRLMIFWSRNIFLTYVLPKLFGNDSKHLDKPFNDLKQLKKLQPKKLNKNSKSTRNKISF